MRMPMVGCLAALLLSALVTCSTLEAGPTESKGEVRARVALALANGAKFIPQSPVVPTPVERPKVVKSSLCPDGCDCGCEQGGKCTCPTRPAPKEDGKGKWEWDRKEQTWWRYKVTDLTETPAPITTPVSYRAPAQSYYQTPVQNYQPQMAAPVQYRQPQAQYAPQFRSFNQPSRSSGGSC